MAYTTIDDPSAYFHTQLYTGTGSSQAVTNNANAGNFKPDWLWIKCRSNAASNKIFDSSRLDGSGNPQMVIQSDSTSAENDVGGSDFTSIDANGFTVLGANPTGASSRTYVAWQWKANGGTTSSNSNGSITSTVQANTTAGFSIVTYTGNGSVGATIGHGLGAVPHVFIGKQRSNAENWIVYHHKNTSAPETDFLSLNLTDATADNVNAFNDTAPTSSVMTLGGKNEVNTSGRTYVGYFFTEKQGYSKFGSYTGNGNADGPFVYTGFKIGWLMVKRTDTTNDWAIYDVKRGSNGNDIILKANSSDDDGSGNNASETDLLSNGFKMRSTSLRHNASGGTYIYMAFGETFVSSEGVPTTAR